MRNQGDPFHSLKSSGEGQFFFILAMKQLYRIKKPYDSLQTKYM